MTGQRGTEERVVNNQQPVQRGDDDTVKMAKNVSICVPKDDEEKGKNDKYGIFLTIMIKPVVEKKRIFKKSTYKHTSPCVNLSESFILDIPSEAMYLELLTFLEKTFHVRSLKYETEATKTKTPLPVFFYQMLQFPFGNVRITELLMLGEQEVSTYKGTHTSFYVHMRLFKNNEETAVNGGKFLLKT